MRVLLFSSLFPNARRPEHGVFVEHRLRQLLAFAPDVQAQVVAPVPWFGSRSRLFGRYADWAAVDRHALRYGVDVWYPRYPVIPKIGMTLAPWLMYLGVRGAVARIRQGFDFDLIDAHYLYPDGVAAMFLAAEFARPYVVTGRGSDLSLLPRYAVPRRMIRKAALNAGRVIVVAAALRAYLHDLDVPDSAIEVLRNGVDLGFFRPAEDRGALRESLGYRRRTTLLSVGHLIERKGHNRTIEAIAGRPDLDLVIIGEGPQRTALQQLIVRLALADRVRLLGQLSQQALLSHYQAADLLVLASNREGWANVLLESMACGTPVVATPVDGTPEVVASRVAGRLSDDCSVVALGRAIDALLREMPERSATRVYAQGFDWEATSRGQYAIFRQLLGRVGTGC